ncbi:helix-turn-helix domain-containing protein [Candidatus Gracilibacteria bacterium]|nr:helix-turn-helix domain-containing protein [Candidatus Gracilibacteria bacterium]
MSYQATLRRNIITELNHYKDNLDGFLEDILTPQEIEALDERIKIMHALVAGKTQREIAEELELSITTVSRGSRILQYGRIKGGWRK